MILEGLYEMVPHDASGGVEWGTCRGAGQIRADRLCPAPASPPASLRSLDRYLVSVYREENRRSIGGYAAPLRLSVLERREEKRLSSITYLRNPGRSCQAAFDIRCEIWHKRTCTGISSVVLPDLRPTRITGNDIPFGPGRILVLLFLFQRGLENFYCTSHFLERIVQHSRC